MDGDAFKKFDAFIEKLNVCHNLINTLVDATVTSSMAHRLGFNELSIKRLLKRTPNPLRRQLYEGVYEGKKVAIVALKTWDTNEARRLAPFGSDSPYITTFHGYAINEGIYYLTFEYANHGTVKSVFRLSGRQANVSSNMANA